MSYPNYTCLPIIMIMLLFLVLLGCSDSGDDIDGDFSESEATEDGDSTETDGNDSPDGDQTEVDDGEADLSENDIESENDEESDGDVDAFEYPDPVFVHELLVQTEAIEDLPYFEERTRYFRTLDVLADTDVRALHIVDNTVFAGTASGILFNDSGDNFERLAAEEENYQEVKSFAENHITINEIEYAVALNSTSIDLFPTDGSSYERRDLPESVSATSVAVHIDTVAIGSDSGVYYLLNPLESETANWLPFFYKEGMNVRSIAIDPNEENLLVATASGVILVPLISNRGKDNAHWTAETGDLPDDDVRDIAVCGGKVLVATAGGLAIRDGESVKLISVGIDGLPTDDLIDLTCKGTAVLIGHKYGATFFDIEKMNDAGFHFDHYFGGRWMPDAKWAENTESDDLQVKAVALMDLGIEANGKYELWLGLETGISAIRPQENTLMQKADEHDSYYVPNFWRMDGFFSSDGQLAQPFDPIETIHHHDHDNDGLWTQMMIGGWCMAYQATGDEKYYDYARKAMDNMFLLIDIPCVDFAETDMGCGFISRSIVRDDEGEVYESKLTQPNWHQVNYEVDGVWADYVWKDDTSSDEVTGHMFGFPVFYDLCAKTDEERREVGEYAARLMRYIVEGGFTLVDLDGVSTFHGHWEPDVVGIGHMEIGDCLAAGYSIDACGEARFGGGWLNSVEILGGLLAAYHMTGDIYFYDAYENLIVNEHYDEVAMPADYTMTITNSAIANHSDHELAMLAYTTLIRYEADDARRAKWIEGLEFLYDHERPERNPWWTGVCAISGCTNPDAESMRRTLREMPLDRREWSFDHTFRKDYESNGNDRFGDPQMDRVLPFDEIRTMWWNGNPYEIISGGDGRGVSSPTAYLLPYWMAIYSGILI